VRGEFAKGVEQLPKLHARVAAEALVIHRQRLGFFLQHVESPRQITVLDGCFAQLDESAHDVDAHLHRLDRRQHVGSLDGAVFGERVGRCSGKLQLGEVVTVCDHLVLFGRGQLEQEVSWKATGVALDGLVQRFCGYAIQLGQIGVDDDLDAAHELDAGFDAMHGDGIHGWNSRRKLREIYPPR